MASIIRSLPEGVRSSVRSGIFLFDSTRVVEELVFNSLDARATKVSVFVSIGSCYVKVIDDGGGITRDGLELAGERYATSKFLNLDDLNATTGNFGFRGEALASISEVSVLEIVTRTCGRPNGYKKVLKGCKSLYLGIDDDRKEVGTTVVVRDLFYNQPVRRNYMQSSPNKALQSIKKCVMRLALVRPNISFKIVDIERENELFCTHSTSPLSLLTNGFGMEVSTSLHDIEVEHDTMKLSGYISGPCNTLNMKVLEYVYINSQFVCKGPIHKLLSQLAIRFEDLKSRGTDDEFQNKKRSRSQPCPAYILNLSCPRSLYDLTYEPSKTYVQFKDWAPILDFIEKAIKRFWEESVACGEPSNGAPNKLQDQPWKAKVNLISTKEDISKFGNLNSKDCLDLFLSTSDKLTEDDYHQTNREDVRTSPGYLHRGTEMFREQQSKRDFLCRDDYSSKLLDVSNAKCFSTVSRKHNSLLMYDNTGLARDYFVDSKFPAAEESFYDSLPFDAPSSSHGKKVYDNLLDRSYAKCMSSVKRKHNSLLMYDKTVLSQGDNFLDGKFPAAESFYDNVPFDAPSSSHGKFFLKADSDVINESLNGDLLYDCHGFSYDVEINRDFQKPFLTRCSTRGSILHEKALFVNDEHEFQIDSFWSKQNVREDCGSSKDLYAHPYPEVVKKLKVSRYSDFLLGEFSEESCLLPDSCYTKTQRGSSGSNDQLLKSECHPVYQEPSSQVNAWDVDHITDINDLGGVFRYYERVHRTKLLDDEENECDFSNMSRKANQDHCTSSFANTEFDLDGAVDFSKMFNRLVEWPDCSDICSTKRSDILNEEPDWLLPESCVENCQSRNKSKGKRDRFRHPAMENNRERYRRSFSAPPFHRSKRRFFSLNQTSEMIAKRPGQMSNPTFNHREAGDFKHPRQSPGALQTSTEDLLLQNFKTDEKQMLDVMGDTQVNDIAEIDLFEGFENLSNTTSRELMVKEVQDSIDNRTKWRKCSSQTPKNDKLVGVRSQNNILDITSGFLHLAGDSLIPETISKKCLEDAKVLYQVDKKFIPVVAGSTLAVIDQHAADERIRLEELRQKVLSREAKAITYLDAEQELVLPEIGYQLLHSYCELIKDWGWICNIHTQNSESFKRNMDILHRLPMVATLVAVPCILGVNLNDVDLLEFLQQLAETEGSSTMPPSVIRVLNSKACRGAIMFGDSLLPSECSLIVEELKDTSLCFQCAHGRPTTVPLVNLEALHNQIAKLGLMNDCSNDTWHGLHRHKVCVERATERLCSARGS